jgi:hypothetical protein
LNNSAKEDIKDMTYNNKNLQVKKWKYFKTTLIVLSILVFLYLIFLFPANEKVKRKLYLIEKEVVKKGYDPNWVTISEKRGKIYNSILPLSSKSSNHLSGKAIDIYVLDINGDGIFNNIDISIIENACNEVEKQNPELIGSFGTYITKGYFSKHMIHIDVTGIKKRYR